MSLFYSILLCLILGSKKAVGQYDLWDPLKTEDECILHEYSKDRPECMLGYQRIGDKYYFPDIKGMGYSTWHEAWQMCRFMGGYLASFANIDELNEVANTVYWMGYDVMDSFWVDGNDLAEEGVYMNYESGKKVRSSLFTPGEPNNQGVERCLALWTASGQHYYGLNNFDCNKKQYYICQSKVINVC